MRFADSFTASAGRAVDAGEADAEIGRRLLHDRRRRARATKNVPAGYVLPPACTGDLSQYTSPPALKTRLMTVNASFSLVRHQVASGVAAATTVPGHRLGQSALECASVGTSNASSTRSNFTPIW